MSGIRNAQNPQRDSPNRPGLSDPHHPSIGISRPDRPTCYHPAFLRFRCIPRSVSESLPVVTILILALDPRPPARENDGSVGFVRAISALSIRLGGFVRAIFALLVTRSSAILA